jgi:hypothetical protein
MRASHFKFNPLKTALLTLVVVMSVSVGVFGQGRGRGGDRDRGGDQGLGKKCDKFVNCHDARDGRRDGRGPGQGLRDDRYFRRDQSYRDFNQGDRRYSRRHEGRRYTRRPPIFRNGRRAY